MRVPQFQHFVEATRMNSSSFSVIDAAPEAMLVVNVAGVLVMANRRAELLFNAERDEIVGALVAPLIAIEYRADQSDVTGVLLPARRLDGVVFQAEVSQSVLLTEEESLIIAIIRDVSAQSEIEAERVRVKSTAERILLTAEAQRVSAEGEKTVAERVRLEAEADLVKAEGRRRSPRACASKPRRNASRPKARRPSPNECDSKPRPNSSRPRARRPSPNECDSKPKPSE